MTSPPVVDIVTRGSFITIIFSPIATPPEVCHHRAFAWYCPARPSARRAFFHARFSSAALYRPLRHAPRTPTTKNIDCFPTAQKICLQAALLMMRNALPACVFDAAYRVICGGAKRGKMEYEACALRRHKRLCLRLQHI